MHYLTSLSIHFSITSISCNILCHFCRSNSVDGDAEALISTGKAGSAVGLTDRAADPALKLQSLQKSATLPRDGFPAAGSGASTDRGTLRPSGKTSSSAVAPPYSQRISDLGSGPLPGSVARGTMAYYPAGPEGAPFDCPPREPPPLPAQTSLPLIRKLATAVSAPLPPTLLGQRPPPAGGSHPDGNSSNSLGRIQRKRSSSGTDGAMLSSSPQSSQGIRSLSPHQIGRQGSLPSPSLGPSSGESGRQSQGPSSGGVSPEPSTLPPPHPAALRGYIVRRSTSDSGGQAAPDIIKLRPLPSNSVLPSVQMNLMAKGQPKAVVTRQPTVQQQQRPSSNVLRRTSQSLDGTYMHLDKQQQQHDGSSNSGGSLQHYPHQQPQARTSNGGLPMVAPQRTSLTGNLSQISVSSVPHISGQRNADQPSHGRHLPSLPPQAMPSSGASVTSSSPAHRGVGPPGEATRDPAQKAFTELLGQQQLQRSATVIVSTKSSQLPVLHSKGTLPLVSSTVGTHGDSLQMKKPVLAPMKT